MKKIVLSFIAATTMFASSTTDQVLLMFQEKQEKFSGELEELYKKKEFIKLEFINKERDCLDSVSKPTKAQRKELCSAMLDKYLGDMGLDTYDIFNRKEMQIRKEQDAEETMRDNLFGENIPLRNETLPKVIESTKKSVSAIYDLIPENNLDKFKHIQLADNVSFKLEDNRSKADLIPRLKKEIITVRKGVIDDAYEYYVNNDKYPSFIFIETANKITIDMLKGSRLYITEVFTLDEFSKLVEEEVRTLFSHKTFERLAKKRVEKEISEAENIPYWKVYAGKNQYIELAKTYENRLKDFEEEIVKMAKEQAEILFKMDNNQFDFLNYVDSQVKAEKDKAVFFQKNSKKINDLRLEIEKIQSKFLSKSIFYKKDKDGLDVLKNKHEMPVINFETLEKNMAQEIKKLLDKEKFALTDVFGEQDLKELYSANVDYKMFYMKITDWDKKLSNQFFLDTRRAEMEKMSFNLSKLYDEFDVIDKIKNEIKYTKNSFQLLSKIHNRKFEDIIHEDTNLLNTVRNSIQNIDKIIESHKIDSDIKYLLKDRIINDVLQISNIDISQVMDVNELANFLGFSELIKNNPYSSIKKQILDAKKQFKEANDKAETMLNDAKNELKDFLKNPLKKNKYDYDA